jgi:pyruvate dehydrogenase E2 component (dihydrolipoamide acetyltransferase)
MAKIFKMPQLGLTMTEGTLTRWYKQPGETVEPGELLFEVTTEKIANEIECTEKGTLLTVLVGQDETVPVGTSLCVIGSPSEIDQVAELLQDSLAQPFSAEPEKSGRNSPDGGGDGEAVKISPLAKRMAQEAGLEISSLTGSGPSGRIVKEDVERVISAKASAPSLSAAQVRPAERELSPQLGPSTPLAGARKIIATRMLQSLQTSAQLTITTEANVSQLVELRSKLQESSGRDAAVKITYSDLITKATAKALEQHRELLAVIEGDQIRTKQEIDIAIAMHRPEGLIVPVIRNCNLLSLSEIAQTMRRLQSHVKNNSLQPDEVTGGTFTITNLGSYGIDAFTPIINQPQSGILGIGRIVQKPVISANTIVPAWMINLSLSFDHRLIDGVPAAQFLQTLTQILAEPMLMFI